MYSLPGSIQLECINAMIVTLYSTNTVSKICYQKYFNRIEVIVL